MSHLKAYNWANAIFKDSLRLRSTQESLKLPSSIDLHKKLVAEVKSVNPWYYQTNKNVPQQAIKDLRTAWDRFFKKLVNSQDSKKKESVIVFILNLEVGLNH